MLEGGCTEPQVRRFVGRVEDFLSGNRTEIAESEIEAIDELASISEIEADDSLLAQAALVKLNGGLGTSMGLTGPKGLLEVKEGHDFYSILVGQVCALEPRPPLLLMNSFSTEAPTEARLKDLDFQQSMPSGFLQSRAPKIKEDGTLPDAEEEWAWCPTGHGDIYASLLDSGLIEELKNEGIRYLFVSNIDNLGAVLDSRPLVYMREHGLTFLMEVTRRTDNDRKGGHLARSKDGGLLLREIAQCPEEDLTHFQDINKHRFFNTNNLWIDLNAVTEAWTELPLIVNRKPVKPHQPDSPQVVQLEQAMGAAIGIVEKAGAIEVERDRFAPVKTTNELFLLRSDLFTLDERFHLVANGETIPRVNLDPEHYKLIESFEDLVDGVPSLREVNSVEVEGAVRISPDMSWKGDVRLKG